MKASSNHQEAIKPHQKENFQLKMEQQISTFTNVLADEQEKPTLLLHSCCAPCSTSVIELLCQFFKITVFFYNPNIDDHDEYTLRADEQRSILLGKISPDPIAFLEGDYDIEKFTNIANELALEKEGGLRCTRCYELRLEKTAETAQKMGFDYFCTTLTVSPLKNAQKINSIAAALGQKYKVQWLWSDFKKKNGYARSVQLSAELSLYRQNYCGCSFSKQESLS